MKFGILHWPSGLHRRSRDGTFRAVARSGTVDRTTDREEPVALKSATGENRWNVDRTDRLTP